MSKREYFDVAIVGGSYAGLSAAMALGRSLRSVVVIDSGKPCNEQTPYSHNFITQDGRKPAEIAQEAKRQVLEYDTIHFVNDRVEAVRSLDKSFEVNTAQGTRFFARKVLFATGVKDQMLDISGFAECWGVSVLHCPYCHGYEVKREHIGILANGDVAMELVKLIQHWAGTLTLFTNGASTLSADELGFLQKIDVRLIEEEVDSIEHVKGQLKGVKLNTDDFIPIKAMFTRVPMQQHSAIPITLGCTTTEQGHIEVDTFQRTSVAGVFAAGDNCTFFRSVAMAVAAGSKAGAVINMDLIQEDLPNVHD